MANTQAQFGFKQMGYQSGGAPDFQMSVRAIQSTYATKIGFGDPVIRSTSATAYIIQATGTLATSNPIEGIFVGCQYTPTSGLQIPTWSPSWPGVTVAADAVAYVIDAPNAQFLVATLQTAAGTADIGKVVNFTTGTPSTVGGQYSVATIDMSTATAAGGTAISSLPFRIVGLYGSNSNIGALSNQFGGVGNGTDPSTNYNWAVVTFNNQVNKVNYAA